MKTVQDRLYELRDETYAAFQAKLTPTVAPELFIGVRVPLLRDFAKRYASEAECALFLEELPHPTYDENMLHGLLISQLDDFDAAMSRIEAFLPYVDNWAVCDSMSPKTFKRHRAELVSSVRRWAASEYTYTCRFGIKTLMAEYLDGAFDPDYLKIAADVRSEEYYVRMMVAWYFATALAKQWDATIPYIENRVLSAWTHNKAIQKARESRRISEGQKAYLKQLKV